LKRRICLLLLLLDAEVLELILQLLLHWNFIQWKVDDVATDDPARIKFGRQIQPNTVGRHCNQSYVLKTHHLTTKY